MKENYNNLSLLLIVSLPAIMFFSCSLENTNNSVEDAAKGSDADIKKLLTQTYLTPLEVRKQIFQIWEKHGGFLSILYGAYPSPTAKRRCCSADMFFIEILPVAPSRFRPVSMFS